MIKKIIVVALIATNFINPANPANAGIFSSLLGIPSNTSQSHTTDNLLLSSVVGAVGVGVLLTKRSSQADYLSYHLPEVKSYFNKNQKEFTPIKEIVLQWLQQPGNQETYDRYKRLAEKMGLPNISRLHSISSQYPSYIDQSTTRTKS
jgi:hypothetical protein